MCLKTYAGVGSEMVHVTSQMNMFFNTDFIFFPTRKSCLLQYTFGY